MADKDFVIARIQQERNIDSEMSCPLTSVAGNFAAQSLAAAAITGAAAASAGSGAARQGAVASIRSTAAADIVLRIISSMVTGAGLVFLPRYQTSDIGLDKTSTLTRLVNQNRVGPY
jgi:hypothetical protein